jgi:antitoxin CptB
MERPTRLRQLYFRSAHRGSKETDLILGPFATEHLDTMNDAELDEFEAFLAESDTDIWDWVAGKSLPGDGRYTRLIDILRKRHALSV